MHAKSLVRQSSWFLRDIKVSHTLFSLPYVVISFFATSDRDISWILLVKIVLALACARTFAMGFNRYADRNIDRLNPRTKERGLPSERYTEYTSRLWLIFSAILFICISFSIDGIAGFLSFAVLLILGGYSFLKRWTWSTHFYLGMCLGLSTLAVPVCFGRWPELKHWSLFSAVLFWTAGFDIIYALQDMTFDRSANLYSVPAKFGARWSYFFSMVLFVLMILSLSLFARLDGVGEIFWSGVVAVAGLLCFELWLIRDVWRKGHSRWLGFAFFQVNASVGLILAALYLIERFK